ncbi:hypothetical protein ES705_19072 [subsurface metagenome]
MKNSFYDMVKVIDRLQTKEKLSFRDSITLLKILRWNKYKQYFFTNFEKIEWFDMLLDAQILDNNSIPRRIKKGDTVSYPQWWPGKYLVKVASKIPDKVFAVVKKIETNNISALADCAQAILSMSPEFLKENAAEVVNLFDKWLDLEYTGYIDDIATNLFKKYLNLEFFDETCMFLNILSKTKLVKPKGVVIFIGVKISSTPASLI